MIWTLFNKVRKTFSLANSTNILFVALTRIHFLLIGDEACKRLFRNKTLFKEVQDTF